MQHQKNQLRLCLTLIAIYINYQLHVDRTALGITNAILNNRLNSIITNKETYGNVNKKLNLSIDQFITHIYAGQKFLGQSLTAL